MASKYKLYSDDLVREYTQFLREHANVDNKGVVGDAETFRAVGLEFEELLAAGVQAIRNR